MNLRKTIKGASPLGGFILAIGVILIAAFGLVGWIGGYQLGNHETINPYLANQINALGLNASSPAGGIFDNGFNSNIVTQANNTHTIIGQVSAAASAAGSAFSYVGVITTFVNPFSPGNFVNIFVIGPLTALGVPSQYAAYIGWLIVLAMLAILTLSALLIFNLL